MSYLIKFSIMKFKMQGAHLVYACRGTYTKGILLLLLPVDEWLLRKHTKLIPQLLHAHKQLRLLLSNSYGSLSAPLISAIADKQFD